MGRGHKRAFRVTEDSDEGVRSALDEEMAFHLQAAEDELVEAGWAREEARREALRQFGDVNGTIAYCAGLQAKRGREERRAMTLHEIAQDVRYAVRTLRKAPGYAALVVVTLAFGIAANTTVFSAINPYMIRDLPFDSPDELVQVNQLNPVTGWAMDRFSYPQVEDWTARTRAFSDVGAYMYGVANLTGPEGPEQLQYSTVTANMLDVLGADPALGRRFLPHEGVPGAERVVILSESLWRRRYNADPSVVGRAVTLDGEPATVVGVMPARFNFPFGGVRLWTALHADASAPREQMNLQIVGRLNPGWTAERAREQLAGIQAELVALYPEADGRMSGVTVKPLRQALNFAWNLMSMSSAILLGAMAAVLLIACVNVASLTLARGTARTREVAVRSALGAGRTRVVRQLLAESLVLALLGGALGVGLAVGVTGLIAPVVPEDLYRVGDIDVDGTVLAFTLAVTLATPVAFGLWPALASSRVDLARSLKEGAKGSGGPGGVRGRQALVVAQVALAVILITGAGLMLRSLADVQDVELGFDADRLVSAEVVLPAGAYPTAAERLAYVDKAVETLGSLPGIAAASAVTRLPLNHETATNQVASPGMADRPRPEWPLAIASVVHPGYFETMGIALLEGRTFSAADGGDAVRAGVVSRSLARQLWPGESAVGKTLLAGPDGAEAEVLTVVGVVADVRHREIVGMEFEPHVYRSTLQSGGRRYFLVARAGGAAPSSLVEPARQALLSVDGDLPVNVRPMTHIVRENLLQWGVGSAFLGAFGAGALLLAALGIYGLIAFSVAQRRTELGVRIALGATRRDIRRAVVGGGVRLTMVGLAIGLAAGAALARLASAALYGVPPHDPPTLAVVALLFLGVAAAASWIPAARASRADPASVMRSE